MDKNNGLDLMLKTHFAKKTHNALVRGPRTGGRRRRGDPALRIRALSALVPLADGGRTAVGACFYPHTFSFSEDFSLGRRFVTLEIRRVKRFSHLAAPSGWTDQRSVGGGGATWGSARHFGEQNFAGKSCTIEQFASFQDFGSVVRCK